MKDVLYNLFKEIPIMKGTDYRFPNPKTKEPYRILILKELGKQNDRM